MEVGVVRRHGSARMWTMLVLSLLLLVPLGVLSNTTHSLLLTLEVYHMLYNALTLGGWLLSVRLDAAAGSPTRTFGWARLEVLTTVVTLLFMAALCFSISVEAIQSLANAAHSDDMHHPVYVMACAAAILLANLVCYILIGGYTCLQSTLLAPSEAAKRLSPAASEAQLRPDSRLVKRTPAAPLAHHFARDLSGAVLLVISATTAYMSRAPAVRYLDPALALLSVAVLVSTSRSLFSECCLILLQTMPATFDVAAFRTRLLAAFPAVQDVHELHVWQLTPDCVVATAHVVLAGPQQFNDVAERVTAFFAAHAVGRVTLQPEFSGTAGGCTKSRCLLPCSVDSCANARCCDQAVLRRVPTIRVTPPSQVSLVGRGGSMSKTGSTTSLAKERNHSASTNGDCMKYSVERDQTLPGNGTIHSAEKDHALPANGIIHSAEKDQTLPGGGSGTGDGAGVAAESSNSSSTAPSPEPPVPAPRGVASEETKHIGNAPQVTAITNGCGTDPAPSENGLGQSSPSEGTVKTRTPSDDVRESVESSDCADKRPSPAERSSKALLKTDSPAESYGSVSSVGDWRDAEG
ncbi:zinc transporter 1-like [Amphibalanus amphitrite]|uniref:zinc transporter 1-like n=1 Tax=Amphibalanus amphitrite TaxID=1232801 RepID=UPI001C915340|nr:zinc transporter 1-like [Amphibalanus amphitrite]